jgi:hypothetical protein
MTRQRWIVVSSMLVLVGSLGCRCGETVEPQKETVMHAKTIQQVQQEHTDEWMAIPGVVGTAISQCDGKPCILVLTAANPEHIKKRIPATVEGYPVVVQYTGEIRALDERQPDNL